jgi:ABC-type bacteriocin/lantibiotic exporter with double-glycine peptidase domain
MCNIIHRVPLISQEDKNLCWHASAQMIARFKGRSFGGARIQERARENRPSTYGCSFLIEHGFAIVMDNNRARGKISSLAQLADMLRNLGPIFTLISDHGSPHLPTHAVVIYGTRAGKIGVNDPSRGVVNCNLEGLNKILAGACPTPMMYMR